MNDKILYIESRSRLSYRNNHIVITLDGEEKEVFFDSISTVIVENLSITFSSYLMAELIKHNINVIFCDFNRNPIGSVLPFGSTKDSPLKIKEQSSWAKDNRNIVWKKIVEDKISSQLQILDYFNINISNGYNVEDGDKKNTEAIFARRYFVKLFGRGFRRNLDNSVNYALNYGYTILMSQMSRIIASYGYMNQLGIHHRSEKNNFNFACDIMEPFRPIIDFVVKINKDEEFDSEYKHMIAEVLGYEIQYGAKTFSLKDAMELYFLDIVQMLETGKVPENIIKLI